MILDIRFVKSRVTLEINIRHPNCKPGLGAKINREKGDSTYIGEESHTLGARACIFQSIHEKIVFAIQIKKQP